VTGEAVWVGLYVGIGYAFAESIETASDILESIIGVVGLGAAALGLGY